MPDPAPPAFVACGGAPFGVWQLVDYDATGVRLLSCPTRLEAQGSDDKWLIRFGDLGAVEGPGNQRLRVVLSVTNACIQKDAAGCAALSTFWTTCASADGLCTCDTGVDFFHMLTPQWTREGGTLTFPNGGMLSYCVDQNTLTVVDAEGVRYKLERRTVEGTPRACGERSAAECTRGSACHPGACTGEAICELQSTEAQCTNRMACSWNASNCGGLPGLCALQDYGTVPGCVLSPP